MYKTGEYRQLEQHVPIIAWLHIGLNVLLLLIAGFVFLLLVGTGVLSGDAEAMTVTSIIGVVVGGFLALLGMPGILTGIGLLKRKSWARILAIILAIFNLLNFPLGTALGAYTLWALLQQDAELYFKGEKSFVP